MPLSMGFIETRSKKTMKISKTKISKSLQVLVPKAVRVALSLFPGDHLEWLIEDEEVKVRKA